MFYDGVNMNPKTDEIKTRVSKAFSKVSGVYDSGRNNFFTDFGRIGAHQMEIPEGSRVLDVAVGRGAFSFLAKEKVGETGTVIGIDLASGMIESTKKEAEKQGIDIKLLQMDAESLDFEDNSFDFAYCGFAIFFFPNLDKALSEIRRVLKPGGKLNVSTFCTDPIYDTEWFYDLAKKHLEIEDNQEEEKSGPVFDTKEGLTDIFEKANFHSLEHNSMTIKYFYTEDEWWDELFTHGGIQLMDRFTPEKLEIFKKETFEELKKRKEPKGVVKRISVLYAMGVK